MSATDGPEGPAGGELHVRVAHSPDAALRDRLGALWAEAFDDFTETDGEHAYGGVHIVAGIGDEVVGHASAVPRELRIGDRWLEIGYVEAVATRPAHQRRGIGTTVMRALHEEMAARWPLAFLSTGEHDFYLRLGWEPWRGPTYVEGAEGTRRTADEDDGVMVLRLDPDVLVDRAVALTCRDRPGDAW